eukprot:scaffold916_cov92-Isochrysis_galbana.AAC.6
MVAPPSALACGEEVAAGGGLVLEGRAGMSGGRPGGEWEERRQPGENARMGRAGLCSGRRDSVGCARVAMASICRPEQEHGSNTRWEALFQCGPSCVAMGIRGI